MACRLTSWVFDDPDYVLRKDRIVDGEQRSAKLVSKSAEDIFRKPLTKSERAVLGKIARRQTAGDDSGIDFSDIPELTRNQLAQFQRTPKVLVAARLDREVFDWLKQFGEGYSTRINSILRAVMERQQ